MRVVRDLPRPVHALHEPEPGQAGAEGIRRVLDAAIGVEDDARPRVPIDDRVVERRPRQPRILVALRLQPTIRRE